MSYLASVPILRCHNAPEQQVHCISFQGGKEGANALSSWYMSCYGCAKIVEKFLEGRPCRSCPIK